MFALFAAIQLTAIGLGDDSPNRPAIMNACEQYRKSIETADLLWTADFVAPNGVERKVRYRTRIAPDQYVLLKYGDEHGVINKDERGQPYSIGCEGDFIDSRGRLTYLKGRATAMLWKYDQPYEMDVRCLGLMPIYLIQSHLDSAFVDFPRASGGAVRSRRYATSNESGNINVIANLEERSIAWTFDAQRGATVLRSIYRIKGLVGAESISSPALFDGIWFPSATDYFLSDEKKPVCSIRILSAEFNRPSHPRTLTPADIGVFEGTMVYPQMEGRGPEYWDGSAFVPMDEFRQRVRDGKAKFAPQIIAAWNRDESRAKTPGAGDAVVLGLAPGELGDDGTWEAAQAHFAQDAKPETGARPSDSLRSPMPGKRRAAIETQWERYTREFLKRHRLKDAAADASRHDKAMAILGDSEKLAAEHFERHARDLDRVDAERDSIRMARGDDAMRRRIALDREWDKLIAPLDEIFEKQLKPRLDGLLTGAERAANTAAARSPSSQPGGGPSR